MQTDVRSTFAQQVLPTLLAVKPSQPGGASGKALALLRDWDGTMAMDLPQPLIFNAWMDRFNQRGAEGPTAFRCAMPGRRRISSPSCCRPPGRTGATATAQPVLRRSLDQAVKALSARFGAGPGHLALGAGAQGDLRPSDPAAHPAAAAAGPR